MLIAVIPLEDVRCELHCRSWFYSLGISENIRPLSKAMDPAPAFVDQGRLF